MKLNKVIKSYIPMTHAERGAGNSQRCGLGDELSRNAVACGTERIARRELLHAAVGADQGQVGDVHGRDEHDEDDTTPQHFQRRPHVANDVSLERQELRAVAGTDEQVLEGPGPLDDCTLCASIRAWARLERDAWGEPQQELVVLTLAAALGELLRRERKRHEHPDLGFRNEERLGQHADDVVDLVVQTQAPADNAVEPAGLRAAKRVAEDATLFLPGVPSASVNSRPRAAAVPSTWKNDGVTLIAETPSACVPSPTL